MLILSPKAGFQSRSRGRRRRRGRSIRASLRCKDYGFLLRVNMLSTAHNHYQQVRDCSFFECSPAATLCC